jgi:hypothetical protein
MSVAEAFSHFDANTMFDNALARVRRTIGVRELPSTVSVQDYLDAQGLLSPTPASAEHTPVAANQSVAYPAYRARTLAQRRSRQERRSLRA